MSSSLPNLNTNNYNKTSYRQNYDLSEPFYIQDNHYNNEYYQTLLKKYAQLAEKYNNIINGNIDVRSCNPVFIPRIKEKTFSNIDIDKSPKKVNFNNMRNINEDVSDHDSSDN